MLTRARIGVACLLLKRESCTLEIHNLTETWLLGGYLGLINPVNNYEANVCDEKYDKTAIQVWHLLR